MANEKVSRLFSKTLNFKVAITKMYSRITWELVTDRLGSVEPTSGATTLT